MLCRIGRTQYFEPAPLVDHRATDEARRRADDGAPRTRERDRRRRERDAVSRPWRSERLEAIDRAERARNRATTIRLYWAILAFVSAMALAAVLCVETIYLRPPWAFASAGGMLLCFVVMARAVWVLVVPPPVD
jgi:hypothetical protein